MEISRPLDACILNPPQHTIFRFKFALIVICLIAHSNRDLQNWS